MRKCVVETYLANPTANPTYIYSVIQGGKAAFQTISRLGTREGLFYTYVIGGICRMDDSSNGCTRFLAKPCVVTEIVKVKANSDWLILTSVVLVRDRYPSLLTDSQFWIFNVNTTIKYLVNCAILRNCVHQSHDQTRFTVFGPTTAFIGALDAYSSP